MNIRYAVFATSAFPAPSVTRAAVANTISEVTAYLVDVVPQPQLNELAAQLRGGLHAYVETDKVVVTVRLVGPQSPAVIPCRDYGTKPVARSTRQLVAA